MVAPKFRSRKFVRAHTKTPGGIVVMHYKKRKHGKAQCAQCGDYLKGVFTGPVHTMNMLSKTQKRPERPYGGVLCSRCMRKVMIEKARSLGVQNG